MSGPIRRKYTDDYVPGAVTSYPRRTKKASKRVWKAKIYRRPNAARGIHHFEYTIQLPNATCNTVGPGGGGAYRFCFQDIPGVSSMWTLFDSVKLDKVVVTFYPNATEMQWAQQSATSGNSGVMFMPLMMTAIDHTDDTPPSASANIREYGTCKTVNILTQFSRTVYPKLSAVQVLDNIVGTSVQIPRFSQWLSTDSITNQQAPHYGLKYYISSGLVAGTNMPPEINFTVVAKYYCSAKEQN